MAQNDEMKFRKWQRKNTKNVVALENHMLFPIVLRRHDAIAVYDRQTQATTMKSFCGKLLAVA